MATFGAVIATFGALLALFGAVITVWVTYGAQTAALDLEGDEIFLKSLLRTFCDSYYFRILSMIDPPMPKLEVNTGVLLFVPAADLGLACDTDLLIRDNL